MGWKLAGFMLLKSKANCWKWFWQLVGINRHDFEFELYQVYIVGNMETFSARYSFYQAKRLGQFCRECRLGRIGKNNFKSNRQCQ